MDRTGQNAHDIFRDTGIQPFTIYHLSLLLQELYEQAGGVLSSSCCPLPPVVIELPGLCRSTAAG